MLRNICQLVFLSWSKWLLDDDDDGGGGGGGVGGNVDNISFFDGDLDGDCLLFGVKWLLLLFIE